MLRFDPSTDPQREARCSGVRDGLRPLGRWLVGVAITIELATLFFSLLVSSFPSQALQYVWPFAGIMFILQIVTIRRVVARTVVAAVFLVLFVPYHRLACPQSHVESSAASVGGEILEQLQRGSVDEAASSFCEGRCRTEFVATVEKHGLNELRSWKFVRSARGWRCEGSAEFDVVRSDGVERRVLVDVCTRYFRSTVAEGLWVRESE